MLGRSIIRAGVALLALMTAASLDAPARAASLTPPNLAQVGTINNGDLLVVWPSGTGGPLSSVQWSVAKSLMQTALGSTYLQTSNNLSDLLSPATARGNLGLGGAAVLNTGGSGSVVPLLSGTNTWSGAQSFSLESYFAASTTSAASFNIGPGVAPTSPNNGDCWLTSSALYCRIGGVSEQFMEAANNLSDLTNTATAQANLGLGSAATVNTGTSGATVPLLNGSNTWSAAQTFSGGLSGALSGNASTATALATGRTISITGDLTYTSPAFNGSGNVTAAGTLATVNSNTGSFGSGTSIPNFTVNGKGLITAAGATTITAPASIAGFANLKETAPGSAQVVTVTADSVVAIDASGNAYRGTSLSCSLSIASSGSVNTLDTGSAAASTWYYDFAIYNGSTWGCLASASSTAPTLPSGYTARARLGSFRTDGSANVKAYVKYGRAQQWVNTGSGLPIMASGSAGSGSTPNAAVATGAFAPPTAASIAVAVYANNSVSAAAPNGSYGALNSSFNAPPVITITQSGDQNSSFARFVLEGSNIYWYSGNTNGALYAVGYDDNL